MYYTSSHLPESGGQLLITSFAHDKKIVVSSSTDIVLSKEQLKLYTMTSAAMCLFIYFQKNDANIITFSVLLDYINRPCYESRWCD